MGRWSWCPDLNWEHAVYKAAALSVELHQRNKVGRWGGGGREVVGKEEVEVDTAPNATRTYYHTRWDLTSR